jgi:hypothetical protein
MIMEGLRQFTRKLGVRPGAMQAIMAKATTAAAPFKNTSLNERENDVDSMGTIAQAVDHGILTAEEATRMLAKATAAQVALAVRPRLLVARARRRALVVEYAQAIAAGRMTKREVLARMERLGL